MSIAAEHGIGMIRCVAIAVAFLGSAGIARPSSAQQIDTVRGVVHAQSGAPLPDAQVAVTVVPTTETAFDTSRADGQFAVRVPRASGEYIVHVSALGYASTRRRVEVPAATHTLYLEFALVANPTALPTVRVVSRPPIPTKTLGMDGLAGADATDRSAEGVVGALPPGERSSFAALASLLPGLTTTADGVTALGVGAIGNTTTLNGSSFGADQLPAAAKTSVRFRVSPWDPTVGGFSGVQTAATVQAGSNIATKELRVGTDALLGGGVAARGGGSAMLDVGGAGPLTLDKYFYNYGLHFDRRVTPAMSLTSATPQDLSANGVSADSASQLVTVLNELQVPVMLGRGSNARVGSNLSFIERIDVAPPYGTRAAAPVTAVTLFGSWAKQDGLQLSPHSLPTGAGTSEASTAFVQVLRSRYFGEQSSVLNESSASIGATRSSASPYSHLPGASVRLGTQDGLAAVGFGGNSQFASRSSGLTIEGTNQTSIFLSGKSSLPFRILAQGRYDRVSRTAEANTAGQFTFESIDDLRLGRASSYTRTLEAPHGTADQFSGALAIGANWNAGNFAAVGGVRLDASTLSRGNASGNLAPYSQAAGGRLGFIDLSPRVGLTWRMPRSVFRTSANDLATVSRGWTSLRAGVGKFQTVLGANALSSLALTNAFVASIACSGASTPGVDWSSWSSEDAAPRNCAGTEPAGSARRGSIIADGYAPPESWRASIGWTASSILGSYVSVDATRAWNRREISHVDRNFVATPRFSLADEDNRPVFVPPDAIDAGSGVIADAAARTNTAYSTVDELRTDLHGTADQLALSLIPRVAPRVGVILLGYTWMHGSREYRGFDATTSGDPFAVERTANAALRTHQIILQYARHVSRDVTLTAAMRAASGVRYTPIVGGDVNGDGRTNDRAFVFDPTRRTDDTAPDLTPLIERGGSASARCLARQLGSMAGAGSCTGPWLAVANVTLGVTDIPKTRERAHGSITISNVGAALDRVLHGASHQRGWGANASPDPVLYYARSFDPARQRFQYETNPFFGRARPLSGLLRGTAGISMEVRIDLGRSPVEQNLEQSLRIRPSLVGSRADADTIRNRLMRAHYSDIYGTIVRLADSIALSRSQMEALTQQAAKLRLAAAEVFGPLAARFAALPADYSVTSAVDALSRADDEFWAHVYAEVPTVLKETLLPGQIGLLPTSLRRLATEPDYRGRFVYPSG